MKIKCLYSVFFILLTLSLNAQQKRDEQRLVRLIKAESAQTFESGLVNMKRVAGNAQFLHNNALIICDTAIWDVTKNIIDAIGNVKIIQEKTVLSGDRIHYIADSSLAQVRGSIVELLDSDSNRLRTFYLDYNTKDSIAYFFNGGSMMDSTGKVIESLRGYYHSKIKRFKFLEQVEMTAEDMVLKSDSLVFWSETNKVDFLGAVNAWQNQGFLSSKTGWYERNRETYNFEKEAYILNANNEIWGDRILYQKELSTAQLWDNVQIVDTAQSIILFADYAFYRDSGDSTKGKSTWAKLYNRPAIAYYSIENEGPDTLFFSADTINYKAISRYLVDSATIALSNKRYENTKRDPIKEMYGKPPVPIARDSTPSTTDSMFISRDSALIISDSSFVAIEEALTMPDSSFVAIEEALTMPDSSFVAIEKALTMPDSTFVAKEKALIIYDSTLVALDAEVVVLDSSLTRFVDANKNVKFYRSDFQGKCDSLRFNSIDSIIRLYKDPVLWNEKNQFTADSIQLFMSNNRLRKLDLMSNSFVISPEDSLHYNQIKSTDMVAYFTEGDLTRFDAYGGVSLIIFIAEDSILTTMNKKECKVMTAKIKDRQAERIKYIDNVPSDAYPVIDLKPEQKQLKGFVLRENDKPKDRFEVCDRVVVPTKREEVGRISLPNFQYTWRLFKIKPQLPVLLPTKPELTTKEKELTVNEGLQIDKEGLQIEKELPIKITEESSLLE